MDLSGKLLVAMPGMADPRFDRSVILLCSYSDAGAMGLMINRPVPGLHLQDLLQHSGLSAGDVGRDDPVYSGGPVERGRGFVLHSPDWTAPGEETLCLPARLCMTQSRSILEAVAEGEGPAQLLVTLGYSGWGAGQLDDEIGRNAWLTVDADPRLVFGTECEAKWAAALRRLGVEPLALSATAGRA